MDYDTKPVEVEEEAIARAAYQPDGSFGTSPATWGITNIFLDPHYRAASIITGSVLFGLGYMLFSTGYPNIILKGVASSLVVCSMLFIVNALIKILSPQSDSIVRFRQFTLFPDRMLLLPGGMALKYVDIEYIEYSISDSISEIYSAGNAHTFAVASGGVVYRWIWYGPSIPGTVFDYNLSGLLKYLGFREVDSNQFKYDPSLAPRFPINFVPVKPSIMSRRMSPATMIASIVVAGFAFYLLWSQIAVKILQ